MDDSYMYTVPADDTVPLESPSPEVPLESLYLHDAVVGKCESLQNSADQIQDYCCNEVVPDSDDDEDARHNGDIGREATGLAKRRQVFTGYSRRLSKKAVGITKFDDESMYERIRLEKTRYHEHNIGIDSVLFSSQDEKSKFEDSKTAHEEQKNLNIVGRNSSEEANDEKKLSLHNPELMDKKLDAHYGSGRASLTCAESPEPTESQGNATDFVNYYLSVSDLSITEDVEAGKTKRIKSPPSLRSRGSQNLARRVHLEGSSTNKSSTFDWVDSQSEKGSMNDSIVGFEGRKSRYLSVNKESDIVNMQNEKISDLQTEGKFLGSTLDSNNLFMTPMHSNESDRVGSNCESRTVCVSIKLNELAAGFQEQNVEKSEQVKATPDEFDFGLDTQIAAEAMEALIHASPPKFDNLFAQQGLDDAFLDHSGTVNKKSKQKRIVGGEAVVGWRKKQKRSKCLMVSTDDINNKVSQAGMKKSKIQRRTVSQLQVCERPKARKVLSEKDLNCWNTRNRKNDEVERPPRIIVEQEDNGFAEIGDTGKISKYKCSSESSECKMDGSNSQETNEKLNSNASRKRRIISFHGDERRREVGDNGMKSEFDPCFQKITNQGTKGDGCHLGGCSSSLLESNPWTYTKGKRTLTYMSSPRNRSSYHSSLCGGVDREKSCLAVDGEAYKSVPKLLVYTRRRQFLSERGISGNSLKLNGDLGSPFVNHNEICNRLVQFPFQVDAVTPSVNTSGELKPEVPSNGSSKTPQVCDGGAGESKQPSKHLSRSPLLKELARLGYPESLPEFLPKYLRRRRAMEKVCILFSQNLEANILKKQKKIVARLGFSIASCCSDATHFVTNRFVRTMNMLEAIALGKPVVTHLWLESCEQAGYVIDERSYILRDEKKEKEIGFNMPVSLTRASQCPLLKVHRVLIMPNVKPGRDVIRSLVKAVQGQEVQIIESTKMEDTVIPADLLVLSCEEDYDTCLPFLEKGGSIYSTELLLNGIVTQKLEYDRYRLFKDFAKGSSQLPGGRK